jgi:hypothetical protein
MSTLKTNNVQVGQSVTATNNFTLYQPSTPDGTVRLGVGNSGATTADVITANSSGNVGIGTSSPTTRLEVVGSISLLRNTSSTSYTSLRWYNDQNSSSRALEIDYSGSAYSGALLSGGPTGESAAITTTGAYPLVFGTSNTARAMLDSSGNFLVGKTAADATAAGCEFGTYGAVLTRNGDALLVNRQGSDGTAITIRRSNTTVGTISVTTSATAYNTSSDYRLKENIAPMTGALARVAALKPVTYKWKADGSDGEGFIAHELQAVVPDCVTGAKDAVDADGNPQYQGIDTSFLVATLTAAIQEQQTLITSLTARIAALEGAQ